LATGANGVQPASGGLVVLVRTLTLTPVFAGVLAFHVIVPQSVGPL
jgi:hypothetical protein